MDVSKVLSAPALARVRSDPGLKALFEHLEGHPPTAFPSVQRACRITAYTDSTLNRRLRNALGYSLRRLRDEIVMRIAGEEILHPRRPQIKEVARLMGYGPQSFSRAFARHYRRTPLEWRRERIRASADRLR